MVHETAIMYKAEEQYACCVETDTVSMLELTLCHTAGL